MTLDNADDHARPRPVASFATEGEAEVARAKLRAYGVDAAIDDQVEGGAVPVEGEPGVILEVRAQDVEDAAAILEQHADPPGA
jgi:hypothetical protein